VAVLAAATSVVLAGLGYYPTVAVSGAAGARVMLIGIGAALFGAWAGSLMPVLFVSTNPHVFFNGLLLGLGVRFAVTLALALVLRSAGVEPIKPLLLWVGIGQVVLLGSDTVAQLRWVRQLTWEGKR